MTNFVLQPTQEGELRRRVLFWLPAPLPVLGVVYLLVGGVYSAAGWTILLAASVGVGTLLLAMVVQPTPLPEGLSPPVSARRSLHRFRQFTGLRIALALVPVLIGAAASVVGGGMYPLFASLALAWPQMLLSIPTFFTITRTRRAMEAWGTTAYLWHALSRSAKVTWPIITPLAKGLRRWRTERAVAQRAARRESELRRSEEREQEEAWQAPAGDEYFPGASTHLPAGRTQPAAPAVDERASTGRADSGLATVEATADKENADTAADQPAEQPADQPADGDAGRVAGPETEEGVRTETAAPAPAVGGSRSTASTPVSRSSGAHQGSRQPREQGGGAPGRTARRPRRSQSGRRPHSSTNKP